MSYIRCAHTYVDEGLLVRIPNLGRMRGGWPVRDGECGRRSDCGMNARTMPAQMMRTTSFVKQNLSRVVWWRELSGGSWLSTNIAITEVVAKRRVAMALKAAGPAQASAARAGGIGTEPVVGNLVPGKKRREYKVTNRLQEGKRPLYAICFNLIDSRFHDVFASAGGNRVCIPFLFSLPSSIPLDLLSSLTYKEEKRNKSSRVCHSSKGSRVL